MKKIALALVAAVTVAAGMSSVAAQSPADTQKYDKGSIVTLQGCVVSGEKKDTWVLTNVKEWPAGVSDMGKYGRRYYRLDKLGKDLRAHGGHTIQVIGKIDSVGKSEIETYEDPTGMIVKIEGAGRDVKTTKANAQAVGAIAGQDIPITLLTVKVDELKMVAATCQP